MSKVSLHSTGLKGTFRIILLTTYFYLESKDLLKMANLNKKVQFSFYYKTGPKIYFLTCITHGKKSLSRSNIYLIKEF